MRPGAAAPSLHLVDLVSLVCLVYLVCLVFWLNEIHEMNPINQMSQRNQTDQTNQRREPQLRVSQSRGSHGIDVQATRRLTTRGGSGWVCSRITLSLVSPA